ncbi:tyrosine-type recombinase/integrase [Granulosicoccus sp.]|nr:tyrosine-type recombinase/integrase [Granulosicoccus sp.]
MWAWPKYVLNATICLWTDSAQAEHCSSDLTANECLLCLARHRRHTAACRLLESGVDVNVIRAWLGNVSLEMTNHYAEINTRPKRKH